MGISDSHPQEAEALMKWAELIALTHPSNIHIRYSLCVISAVNQMFASPCRHMGALHAQFFLATLQLALATKTRAEMM